MNGRFRLCKPYEGQSHHELGSSGVVLLMHLVY